MPMLMMTACKQCVPMYLCYSYFTPCFLHSLIDVLRMEKIIIIIIEDFPFEEYLVVFQRIIRKVISVQLTFGISKMRNCLRIENS